MRRLRTKKMEKTMPEGLGFRVWPDEEVEDKEDGEDDA